MKLACVDKTASNRLELQRLIMDAFDCSKEAIGHLPALDFAPVTKEEILISGLNFKTATKTNAEGEWSGIILGPGYVFEELFCVASEFRASSSTIAIFCFIPSENYSIRILRKLEKISVEVFRIDDSPARVVHSILRVISKPSGRCRPRASATSALA